MKTTKAYRRRRRFWCEFFGDHDWKAISQFETYLTKYIMYECTKCKMKKSEPISEPMTGFFNRFESSCSILNGRKKNENMAS